MAVSGLFLARLQGWAIAVGDYTSLAAPGAGQDEQRTFHVGNLGALLGVQAFKEVHENSGEGISS